MDLTYASGSLHVLRPAPPVGGLPGEHERRGEDCIRVILGKGIEGLAESHHRMTAVFEDHLADHGTSSDVGDVLGRESQQSVHHEAMRGSNADDTG